MGVDIKSKKIEVDAETCWLGKFFPFIQFHRDYVFDLIRRVLFLSIHRWQL